MIMEAQSHIQWIITILSFTSAMFSTAVLQVFQPNQVYVAMLIILLLAGAITGLKMYLVQKFGPTPDPKYDQQCSA